MWSRNVVRGAKSLNLGAQIKSFRVRSLSVLILLKTRAAEVVVCFCNFLPRMSGEKDEGE